MTQYCAYFHVRPNTIDASGIFYVGKGTIKRAVNLKRNKHHSNIVEKYGKENILIGKLDCSSEEIAFQLEKGLIKCLKRMDVNLTNQTDGGEGSSGYRHSEEIIKKLSEINSCENNSFYGKKHSDESRLLIKTKRISQQMPTGWKHTEQAKMKMSESTLGQKSWNKGNTTPECVKNKISESLKGKLVGEANPFFGKKHSKESKENMSKAHSGKILTAEHRAKISKSQIGGRFVNNGIVTKRVKYSEYLELIEQGWVDGMIKRISSPS